MATKEEEEEILRKLREENERANTVISTDDSDRVIMGQNISEPQSAYDITNNALQSRIGLGGPTNAQTLQFTEGQMTTPQQPAELLPNNRPQSLSPQAVTENTMGLNMGLSGPSAAQVLQFTEGQRTDPAGIDYSSQIQPMDYFDDFLSTEPNLAGAFSEQPRMVTNVDLMGNPLRKQPSVEQIRFDSRPDRLASKELSRNTSAFFKGLGQGFMDVVKDPIQAISDATGFYSDPIANYMAGAEGGLPEMIMDAVPNDINLPTLTKENLAEGGLTLAEAVTGRDYYPGGYDFKSDPINNGFNSQGGSNAFKTEGDRILKTSLDSLGGIAGTAGTGGTPLQQGQAGSPQANFVDRMSRPEPLKDSEIAAARAFASSKGFAFDPRTGYSAPSTVNQAITGNANAVMATDAQGRMRSFDSPQARQQNLANAQSAYDQASQARQMRIGGTGSFAGDSAAREAKLRANERQPGEGQSAADTRAAQSRTTGSRTRSMSFEDARRRARAKLAERGVKNPRINQINDLARGIQMGETPKAPTADKLSQATTMVDRMITNGQLSPDKRNAAIQKIVGVGSLDGSSGSGSAGAAGAGVIGSAEFDRVSSQLQEGGSLYNMGIRVDPSVVDPLTGAAQIYREKPGLEFGPPERLPVSQELMQQLLPYARSVRQGGTMTQDFANMGMQVNQFAGSR